MKVVKGNDISICWRIFQNIDGTKIPEDMTNINNTKVLVKSNGLRVPVKSYTITDTNLVTILIKGTDQVTGVYDIEISWTNSQGIDVRVAYSEAFVVVDYQYQADYILPEGIDILQLQFNSYTHFGQMFEMTDVLKDDVLEAVKGAIDGNVLTYDGTSQKWFGKFINNYNRLDNWTDYTVDKSGWVLSAELGKNLNDRVITLEQNYNNNELPPSEIIPITIGLPANGLAIDNNILTLSLASASLAGAMSAGDKKYIDLLRSLFEYDAINNAVRVTKSLYSIGGISAYGLGTEGTGGGGGGVSSFSLLTDVALTDPMNGDIPIFNGTYWVNQPQSILSPDLSAYALKTYVDTKVAGIVNSAPATLDTLNELAAALGNNPNFATTIATQIGGKEPIIAAGTTSQYWRGDKTWATLTTNVVAEGANNLYYTNARVKAYADTLYMPINGGAGLNSITVGEAILKYDSINNALYVEKVNGGLVNFYATGEVSAYGAGTGSGGGGGVSALRLLTDVALTSPISGNVLIFNGTYWENKPQSTIIPDLSLNAASATKLQTARTIWGQSFDGTGNVTGALTGATTGSFSGTVTAPTFSGALSGNATSASILQTIRTIWGQSFNGSANVTGALTFVTDITASGTIQGGYGKFTNLTANYLPKHTASGLTNSLIYDDGTSVGIGTASPSASYKLDVSGTGRFTSDVRIDGLASTDKSVKTFIDKFNSMFDLDTGGNIVAKANLYSVGEVTAYSSGSGVAGLKLAGDLDANQKSLFNVDSISANEIRVFSQNSHIYLGDENLDIYQNDVTSEAGILSGTFALKQELDKSRLYVENVTLRQSSTNTYTFDSINDELIISYKGTKIAKINNAGNLYIKGTMYQNQTL